MIITYDEFLINNELNKGFEFLNENIIIPENYGNNRLLW